MVAVIIPYMESAEGNWVVALIGILALVAIAVIPGASSTFRARRTRPRFSGFPAPNAA